MKKNTTASVLCALLISTFAHGYMHLQNPVSQQRVANHNFKHSSHLAQKRDSFNGDVFGTCGWECPGSIPKSGQDIEIVINATTNLMGVLNVTQNADLIYDFNTKIIETGNGTRGNIMMINLNDQTGTHVIDKRSALFWLSANSTFEQYVNSLPSLQAVVDETLRFDHKFNLSTAGEDVLRLIGEHTLIYYGYVIGKDIKKDYSNALEILNDGAKRLYSVLEGPLKGLFKDITATKFSVNISLELIIERFEGLAYDLNEVQGGLNTLIKHHIKIDLKKIIGAKSGIESLAYLLNSQVNGGLDVVTAIGGNSSIEQTFDVIVHLCGASSKGYSAFVRVVGLVIGAAKGNVSAEVLIEALVKYSINAKDDKKLYDQFNTALKTLLKAIIKTNTDGRVDSTVNDLKKLIKGTLVIGGVNIADVAKIIARNGNNVAIDLVIGVLVALGSAVNVSQSIPTLILYILSELNTSIGMTVIISLFPNIKINGSISEKDDGNLLETLLKGVNLTDIIKTGFDVVKIFEELPVIGNIWVTISGSLDNQSNGSIKLNVVIKSSGASGIVKNILSLLGSALHIDLSTNVNVGVEVGFGDKRKGHHRVGNKHFHKHENRHIEHLKHRVQEKIHHHQQ